MADIPPLFEHQSESIEFLESRDVAFDTSDPGTGKTRVEIEDFAARRRAGSGCLLVVAPKSLLEAAWEADFKKYAPDMVVVTCPANKREKNFAKEADVYVTNTDAAKWLAERPKSFWTKFEVLVIDESTTFKHHTSQRSKAMRKVAKLFRVKRLLTGTPNTNKITDLWHQVLLLDGGRRLGTSFFQFRASVCEPKQVGPMPNMVEWMEKPHAAMAVSQLLQDITIRHVFEECLDIPENHSYSVPYTMSPKQAKIYKQMADYAMALVSSGTVVSAVNGGVVATKLLQIASGAVYGDGLPTDVVKAKGKSAVARFASNKLTGAPLGYEPVDTGRYELIADLIEQRKHSVTFFLWTHQRDGIERELAKRGIPYAVIDGGTPAKRRSEIVNEYQAGMYQTLLAHPASAAHGITLTRGSTTLWASPPHNLEHFIQGNRRIYRAGQTGRTETITVLAPGTTEETVYENLMQKNARQLTMLELLTENFKDR